MQCDRHERFVAVALSQGWTLWEYGTDTDCLVGGKGTPHLAPIWMKPCAWADTQMTPVGCLCCLDLNVALWDYSKELQTVIRDRWIKTNKLNKAALPDPDQPKPLGKPISWLQPYQAR